MASSFNPATPLSYLRSKNQNPNRFPLLLPLPPVRRKSVATGFLAGTPRRRPARSRRKFRRQPPERKMPVGVPMAEVPEESKLLGPIEFEAREMTPSEESRNRESLLILWCYLTCARMFEVLSYTCLVLFFFLFFFGIRFLYLTVFSILFEIAQKLMWCTSVDLNGLDKWSNLRVRVLFPFKGKKKKELGFCLWKYGMRWTNGQIDLQLVYPFENTERDQFMKTRNAINFFFWNIHFSSRIKVGNHNIIMMIVETKNPW